VTTKSTVQQAPPSIVPIDRETYAMLDYAESAGAQSKFEKARQEIRDGAGISPSPQYFADLNRRISERVKNGNSQREA
jgi:hypothetical protein